MKSFKQFVAELDEEHIGYYAKRGNGTMGKFFSKEFPQAEIKAKEYADQHGGRHFKVDKEYKEIKNPVKEDFEYPLFEGISLEKDEDQSNDEKEVFKLHWKHPTKPRLQKSNIGFLTVNTKEGRTTGGLYRDKKGSIYPLPFDKVENTSNPEKQLNSPPFKKYLNAVGLATEESIKQYANELLEQVFNLDELSPDTYKSVIDTVDKRSSTTTDPRKKERYRKIKDKAMGLLIQPAGK